jgi:hypothetical protein
MVQRSAACAAVQAALGGTNFENRSAEHDHRHEASIGRACQRRDRGPIAVPAIAAHRAAKRAPRCPGA